MLYLGDKFDEIGSVKDQKSFGLPSLFLGEVPNDVFEYLIHLPRKSLWKIILKIELSMTSDFRVTEQLK